MRYLKTATVAAIAIMAAMAFAGASAASANTVLCGQELEGEVCPKGSVLPSKTLLGANLEKGTSWRATVNGFWAMQCTTSSMAGGTTAESGEPLSAELSEWAPCTAGSTCSALSASNLPYKVSIQHTTKADGTLTVTSSGKGNPGFVLTCSGATCTYSAPSIVYDVKGGSPAKLIASKEKLTLIKKEGEKSATVCGVVGVGFLEMTATYVLSPSPLFVGLA